MAITLRGSNLRGVTLSKAPTINTYTLFEDFFNGTAGSLIGHVPNISVTPGSYGSFEGNNQPALNGTGRMIMTSGDVSSTIQYTFDSNITGLASYYVETVGATGTALNVGQTEAFFWTDIWDENEDYGFLSTLTHHQDTGIGNLIFSGNSPDNPTILESVVVTVTPGTSYTVRTLIDSTGAKVYLNGFLEITYADTSLIDMIPRNMAFNLADSTSGLATYIDTATIVVTEA